MPEKWKRALCRWLESFLNLLAWGYQSEPDLLDPGNPHKDLFEFMGNCNPYGYWHYPRY